MFIRKVKKTNGRTKKRYTYLQLVESTKTIEGFITGGVFASPAINAGIMYVGGLDGYIYALKE